MAAAFALALQALLGGVLTSEFAAASPHDPFVICFGNDATQPGGGIPANAPDKHPPCALCTLAKAAHAVLPPDEAGMRLDIRWLSVVIAQPAELIFQYDSPTGRYQRGPPQGPLAG